MNVLAVREKPQMSQFIQQEEAHSASAAPEMRMREKPQVLQFRQPEDSTTESGGRSMVQQRNEDEPVPAVIKVISAGGGGANALNRMIGTMSGVQFIAVNTDIQDLCKKSKADVKVQIGSKITGGWGAGGNPEIGEKAAIEDQDAIADAIKDAHMVFITAGMGGGTGTGSAPVIAKIAREKGALTVAVVTTPFEFEANFRMKQAQAGIAKLRECVDTLIIIPNQHLFKLVDNKTTYDKAYQLADEVLCRGVRGISELITKTGFKNTDFADVKTVMKNKGDALMGIGFGSGDNRALDAVKNAIDNPLLEDTSIDGAMGVLINITGPEDITLVEIQDIIKTIKDKCDPDVNLIHGLNIDNDFDNSIQITVVATGFNSPRYMGVNQEGKKSKNSDYIDYGDFVKMRERTKRPEYLGFLPPREYQDDLDVPSLIRNHNYHAEDMMDKAESV
ncbi:MAG: cell division protein FtsZ [Treponema sp.]|jgi:cell division protein FtsZ|nr:cell division protein FtsZ [Treponema sp.]